MPPEGRFRDAKTASTCPCPGFISESAIASATTESPVGFSTFVSVREIENQRLPMQCENYTITQQNPPSYPASESVHMPQCPREDRTKAKAVHALSRKASAPRLG